MDWIETYTAHELTKLLSDTRLTLTEIVDRMHLSSQAMLTRYLKRTVGKTSSSNKAQNEDELAQNPVSSSNKAHIEDKKVPERKTHITSPVYSL
ncbi:MAG: hypothetical protein J6O51_02285 [Bacteroidales bacterium]|nr:hypothetical protein [Bacteroidales bacterium]